MTANLDELAAAEGWDKVVAPELLAGDEAEGPWVAAPMNIHRINWMWASKKALDAAGITELPKTWAEFNADCEKIVAAGKICIAHRQRRLDRRDDLRGRSSTAWTSTSISKAFVEGDVDALRGEGMVKAFEQIRKMVDEVHGSRHRRPRLGHRARHDGRTARPRSSSWATGRSARSTPAASRRAPTSLRPGARPIGASRASS